MAKKAKSKNFGGRFPAGYDVAAYKRRLQILRRITGNRDQTSFAKHLGIDYKRWSNFERGYPVPREMAFMLTSKFPGMSIEWIWFNTKAGLSTDYAKAIERCEREDRRRKKLGRST
jgi:hypothetical protein